MHLHLLSVPYDSGRHGVRMGAGPDHLLGLGLADRLRARGHRVDATAIRADEAAFPLEVATAFELQRRLAPAVRDAVGRGQLPIVLAGNCNTAVGTVSGLGPRAHDVVWLDAHGDFNTPETTVGGFLDGMSIAMLAGHCWTGMTAGVGGFEPVPESGIFIVGVRDLDPLERDRLARSGVTMIAPADAATGIAAALGENDDASRPVYLHLDLDVVDPVEAVINEFAAPGGLLQREVAEVIRAVGGRRRIAAIAVTALDPAADPAGRGGALACALLEAAVDAAAAGA